MALYLKSKRTESFPELICEIRRDEYELKKVAASKDDEAFRAKQEFLLTWLSKSVDAQFRRLSNKVFQFIVKNKDKSNFVLNFYKEFIKQPNIDDSEWVEESKSD